ncbi:hypothetical protein [Sphingomonas aracearum]|uniref:Uncharacterized protein n=1 Tax=Sphingomonas aracearum TaxID=2283317 RepID=A0A369VUU9_9SPHN|nr:hypothetical protein [Sphingomonas aracearum]RDE05863.1 hypothetical protein DVW87_11790 [Sphingomonas aracearum]
MPDTDPNSAPDTLPDDAQDRETAASVLHDADRDDAGGGGLGGADAADPLAARAVAGTSPNAPIDTGVDAGRAGAERDSRLSAAEDDGSEPHPSSR